LHQIDERLSRQQQFLEASMKHWPRSPDSRRGSARSSLGEHMQSGERPGIRESPAFRPGSELVAVAEQYAVAMAVESAEPETMETQEEASVPVKEEASETATTPTNRFQSAIRAQSMRKPARQDSYELAKEQEYLSGVREMQSEASGNGNNPSFDFTNPGKSKASFLKLLRRVVHTWQFETFFALLIFAHAILLGVQIDWECQNLSKDLPPYLGTIHVTLTITFCIEIAIRIAAIGWREFFAGDAYVWNLIDVFLVLIAVIENLADALTEDSFASGSFRILRILRLARGARGLRIVRLLRFIRPLRLLVFSIAVTLKSLIWSVILLFIIIYLFSILFADANLAHFTSGGHAPPEILTERDLQSHFGGVQISMHTLFRAISGGLEWRHASNALDSSIGWGWSQLFTCYIAFCCFAVLNVMTGVFCHSAITSAEQDHEIMVQSMVNEQDRIRAAFADLFRLMDKDGSGTITIKEFEKGFQVETTSALFEALGLKAEDAWTLFRSLDKDGDHRIGESEFVQGCINIRGPARQVDLRRQAQRTRTQLDSLEEKSFDFLILLKHMAHHMDFDPSELLGEIRSRESSPSDQSDSGEVPG